MKSLQPIYGDVLVVHGGGWVHKPIRWWTDSIVDHAAACTGGGLVVDARPWYGVKRHSLKKWESEQWIVLRPDVDFVMPQIKAGMNWLKSQEGKGYDWTCILGFPLANPNIQNPQRWVCSEFVRGWYLSMGISIVERTPLSFTSPQTVLSSLRFTIADHNLTDPQLLSFIQEPILPTFKRQPSRY